MITRMLSLGCALVLAAPPVVAGAAPPRGACHDPESARAVVRELPWAQQALDPKRVWPYTTGSGVTVAVVDSGVDADHPQLRRPGKVLPGQDFFFVGKLRGNFDCVSHGTAVAAIIAADQVPGVGFHGVAPGVRILPVRVSDRETTETGDPRQIDPAVLARGIRYAVDQGARVLNLSVAGMRDEPLIRSAVAYAVKKDVVVVAAAGNSQQDGVTGPSYPAAYDGVVGVGAIEISGKRWSSSRTGPYVDLVAPGAGVLGATRQGGHAYFDGTSFAAPFVAATAALVRSAWPKLTAAQVVERLLATASPAPGGPRSPEYGAGVVSPFRAVTETLATENARPLPAMQHPSPDPAQVALVEHQQATAQSARAMTTVLLLLGLLVAVVVMVAWAGWRRAWRPGRFAAPAAPRPSPDPVPEDLFARS